MNVLARLSLHHLQAALGRIDLLIRRDVLRWQLAGQDATDEFRGLHLSDAQANSILNRPFATHWGDLLRLAPQQAQAFADRLDKIEQQCQQLEAQAQQTGTQLRLKHLQEVFKLSDFERDALLVVLAPALDVKYGQIYSYLQDDVTHKHPSINLVLNLLGPAGMARLQHLASFEANAPLMRHHLIQFKREAHSSMGPHLARDLEIDPTLVAWLLGHYQPASDMQLYMRFTPLDDIAPSPLLPGTLIKTMQSFSQTTPPPFVAFYGPDEWMQDEAARWLAQHLQQPLLNVDLPTALAAGLTTNAVLQRALRDALITRAIPYIECPPSQRALTNESPLDTPMLNTLLAYPGMVIVRSEKQWKLEGVIRSRHNFWVEFPIPAHEQRHALWQHFIGDKKISADLNIAHLAGQFSLTSGKIYDAVQTASDVAIQNNDTITNAHIFSAARTHSSANLAELATKVNPKYTWEDIILPPDQLTMLKEITQTVLGRPIVLHQWGVGAKLVPSEGVTVLFSGPPGTGKTMAAGILGKELRLDLYRIDLSMTVSKYIGETEKNLGRIFDEAENSNAILFFDEADALFGKRSEVKDAHDRYANIEISYLLQRMEGYNGLTILATNLQSNLDEAFTRRLHFSVAFPFPEKEYRLRIWQGLFPTGVPHQELDFEILAQRFKIAGGNIRNIIVGAAYLAAADGGSVTMAHIFHSTRREFQKMGRLVLAEQLVA